MRITVRLSREHKLLYKTKDVTISWTDTDSLIAPHTLSHAVSRSYTFSEALQNLFKIDTRQLSVVSALVFLGDSDQSHSGHIEGKYS